MMLVYRHFIRSFRSEINETVACRMQDRARLAGELSIVRVLNDFQPLSILCIFCMRGFPPPPTGHL